MSAEQPAPVMAERVFRVGEWLVDPALDQISRNTEVIKLEPRTMRLLVRLAETSGQVVSSQQLLDSVWSGVVVASASVYQGIWQLRKLLGDSDPIPTYIATVPRKGYRLIAAVERDEPHHASLSTDSHQIDAPLSHPSAESTVPGKRVAPAARYWVAAVSVLTMIAIATAVRLKSQSSKDPPLITATTSSDTQAPTHVRPPSETQTMAVLPFADLSPAGDMGYFADGITEELISTLAKSATLHVMGSRSVFALKGRNDDARMIGERLRVENILEGSVRKEGERLRISVQLVRAKDGYTLWSQIYDRKFEDVLDVQSSIAGEVFLALAPVVQTGEPREPVMTETILTRNPDAYTSYLRGLHFLRVWVNLEDFRKARDEFLSAVKLDPEFAKAHAYLAHSYYQMACYGLGDGPQMAALANASIDRALQLDPQLSDVWWVKLIHLQQGSVPISYRIDWLKNALASNPSDAELMLRIADLYRVQGQGADALQLFERAHRVDPLWASSIFFLADFSYTLNSDRQRTLSLLDEAERVAPADMRSSVMRANLALIEGRPLDWDRWKTRAVELAPRDISVHGYLSLDYSHLGELDAALYHARRSWQIDPQSGAGPYNVGHILMFSGDLAGARSVIQAANAQQSPDFLARLALAELQYFTDDCAGAVQTMVLARPGLGLPPSSVDLSHDASRSVPILIWCLRRQGNTARVSELMRAFDVQAPLFPKLWGTVEDLNVRMAAALGDRGALISHLDALAKTKSMAFAFSRHEPMIQPYLADPDVSRLLDKLEQRRVEWRKVLPKNSMRVPIPGVTTDTARDHAAANR